MAVMTAPVTAEDLNRSWTQLTALEEVQRTVRRGRMALAEAGFAVYTKGDALGDALTAAYKAMEELGEQMFLAANARTKELEAEAGVVVAS